MLEPALRGLGVEPDVALASLKRFAYSVIHWNRTISNVMGKQDEGRIVVRHLAESIAPAQRLMESGVTSWVDFGSGAGFPAIPLAIAGIGRKWLLVESRRSKTLLLRKVIQDLGLTQVEVVNARLETMELHPDRFDGFTSRATEGLELTLSLAARHVRSGGRAYLWRGTAKSGEIADQSKWRESWDLGTATKLPETLSEVVEFVRR